MHRTPPRVGEGIGFCLRRDPGRDDGPSVKTVPAPVLLQSPLTSAPPVRRSRRTSPGLPLDLKPGTGWSPSLPQGVHGQKETVSPRPDLGGTTTYGHTDGRSQGRRRGVRTPRRVRGLGLRRLPQSYVLTFPDKNASTTFTTGSSPHRTPMTPDQKTVPRVGESIHWDPCSGRERPKVSDDCLRVSLICSPPGSWHGPSLAHESPNNGRNNNTKLNNWSPT